MKQSKHYYLYLKICIQKAKLYQETGNDEILVDIANLAMVEFIEGNHPNKHYKAVDDGIHTEIKEI